VAPAAVFEPEVTAKAPLSVMTSRARRPARGHEMLAGRGRTDLTRLRRTGGQLVTFSAGEALAWTVIRVAERVSIRPRVDGRRPVRLLPVANTTRSNLASGVRFTRRRVTTVTTIVRGEVRRDRQCDSATRRRVTAVATLLRFRRTSHVLRVIEFHVEGFVEA